MIINTFFTLRNQTQFGVLLSAELYSKFGWLNFYKQALIDDKFATPLLVTKETSPFESVMPLTFFWKFIFKLNIYPETDTISTGKPLLSDILTSTFP